jgi:tripartite-type tricarboxylate transporter receptor subunit TctC
MQLFKGLAFATAFLVAAAVSPRNSVADPVENFYRGKSVEILIGYGPGGGFDTYARLLARHFGNFVPGKPSMVPRNMPGGGGMVLANHLYNVAPRNGRYMGTFGPFSAMEALYGNNDAKFDPAKFTWVGNLNQEVEGCGVWKTSGIQSLADLIKKGKDVRFGSSGKASTTYQSTVSLNNLVGTNMQVVLGYRGSKDINLAMQRGEVDGMCGISVSSAMSSWRKNIESGDLKIVVQLGVKKHPFFGDAANVYEHLKNPKDREVAEFIFRANEYGRPIAAPPDLPAERAAALRAAFNRAVADPAFLADAKKLKLPIDASPGEELTKVFTDLAKKPKEIPERARTIISK